MGLGALAFVVVVGSGLWMGFGRAAEPAPAAPPSVEAPRPLAAAAPALEAIDGDTLEARPSGERIRLANIDAPETGGARCAAERALGQRATRRLAALTAGASSIAINRAARTDRYGRTLARVAVDGADVGDILVREGLARPWRGAREPWCAPDGRLRPA